MKPLVLIVSFLALSVVFAGCHEPVREGCPDAGSAADRVYEEMGFDGTTWPRLDGKTVRVLDHGAFGAFDDAKAAFENLTGARVEHFEADDAGSALNRAILEKGDPTFDVLYGVDNVLLCRALEQGVFLAYRPVLADRIADDHVFFDVEETGWPATPVDHGYVAVNWDPDHPALSGATIEDLEDVKAHASSFVTEDPRTSSPGLGFLLATISVYGDGWKDYWRGLFDGGVLVVSGWSEAYENHFSAGYGPDYGGLGDKPIVTSYTTSPAYEHYFGRNESALAEVVTSRGATFHQIETMGIVRGADDLAAAQAWIEFTLTPGFQSLVAPSMAVYPVASGVSADETFGDVDPAPGSFAPAGLGFHEIGDQVDGWVQEWTDLCEAHDCA